MNSSLNIHQWLVGFGPFCHLGPFRNHTAAGIHLSSILKYFVKVPQKFVVGRVKVMISQNRV